MPSRMSQNIPDRANITAMQRVLPVRIVRNDISDRCRHQKIPCRDRATCSARPTMGWLCHRGRNLLEPYANLSAPTLVLRGRTVALAYAVWNSGNNKKRITTRAEVRNTLRIGMAETLTVNVRIAFGHTIFDTRNEKVTITIAADGSDTILQVKEKIAVRLELPTFIIAYSNLIMQAIINSLRMIQSPPPHSTTPIRPPRQHVLPEIMECHLEVHRTG